MGLSVQRWRSWESWLRGAAKGFDALVPAACVGCQRGLSVSAPPLCPVCRSRLPRLPLPRCERCAEPLGTPALNSAEHERCGTCESWPPSLRTVDALFAYADGAARVVRALKYHKWRSVAGVMADAMAPALGTVTSRLSPDPVCPLLVPVPLSRARARERGFNQAQALAEALAGRGLGELSLTLRRGEGGKHQAGVGADKRRANVRGRFWAPEVAIRPDRPAVIVDDVLTTGATALECSDALAEAGFLRIGAVTFARTLRPLDVERAETDGMRSEARG